MAEGLRVTIDLFSGRRNPVFKLTGTRAKEALERLKPKAPLPKREAAPPPSILGYRGLVVEQFGRPARGLPRVFRVVDGQLRGARRAHFTADPKVEDFICGTVPRFVPEPHLLDVIRRQMAEGILVRARHPRKPPRPKYKKPCACAPLYEPGWWNDGDDGVRQPHNNCYNYGTNYRSDTFAQPGLAAGAIYTAVTCPAVRTAAVADALIDSPSANNECPAEGHLVALVTGSFDLNGYSLPDFHWYRKGRNGLWSHKPGGGEATNLDNSGNLISDPRTADRGPYYNFCTFMVVMHGHIKIQ